MVSRRKSWHAYRILTACNTSRKGEHRVRIVVVEDDAEARRFLVRVLQAAGSDVQTYDNLCEAVRAMMCQPCHLLVLDPQQPGLPCETALSLLREVAPGVPVVLASHDPSGLHGPRWARAGAFRVLRKPFDAGEVLDAVDEAR